MQDTLSPRRRKAKAAPADGLTAGAAQGSHRFACLLDMAQVINSSLELDVVLHHLLSQAMTAISAEGGSVMLMDEATHQLRVLAAEGPRAGAIRGKEQSVGTGVAGWVAQSGTPVLLHGATFDERFQRVCERFDVRDSLCAPLRAEDRILGVISLNNSRGQAPFTEEDLALLAAIANHAALAVRNARAYEEAHRQRQTVQRLLQEVTRAQEEERKRISLLIHDGPAQTMFAALRNVELARALADGGPADLSGALDEVESTIRQSINETRAVMIDLRPLCLDEMGLYASLRQYAEQFEKRTGIKTQVVRYGSDQRPPAMIESSFYRIAQEALTNVWKHAEARNARLTLEVTPRFCSLEIYDDGKGFDPLAAAAEEQEHLGLRSIRDRTELAGGQLTVACEKGKGTVIRVSAPLAQNEEAAPPAAPATSRKRSSGR